MPYSVIKNGDKYDILQVPVFRLGTVRDYPYDAEWGQRMLSKMAKRAAAGYLPPVIVGHGGQINWGEEKPAVGFMKNFRIEPGFDPEGNDGTVYCDLCEIAAETMQEIKEMKYPYRSVELWNDAAEISAVALLGASEPYFKFPRLEVENFSREGKAECVLFSEYQLTEETPGAKGVGSESYTTKVKIRLLKHVGYLMPGTITLVDSADAEKLIKDKKAVAL